MLRLEFIFGYEFEFALFDLIKSEHLAQPKFLTLPNEEKKTWKKYENDQKCTQRVSSPNRGAVQHRPLSSTQKSVSSTHPSVQNKK